MKLQKWAAMVGDVMAGVAICAAASSPNNSGTRPNTTRNGSTGTVTFRPRAGHEYPLGHAARVMLQRRCITLWLWVQPAWLP